ncbi:MAG TPA: SemiSWEET transporter [Alphaproteobacteria bacterium]|nr:SemiSWEET transporter [Alphaproteobacteria bacterium]
MQTSTIAMLGYAAGAVTTVSFVPQVYKAWRTKRCDDLSWGLLLLFAAGIFLWLIYGLAIHSTPVIVANSATLVLVVALAVLKMHYRLKKS